MSKKILLIDDEKEIVHIMKKKIQNAGYEVHVSYNGEEGLQAAQELHPHLILTDVAMPVMDGLMFYNELKHRQDIQHIPVIVATAYGTTEDKFRALGAKDFLVKPFDMKLLLDKVGSFFDKQKAFKIMIATKMLYLMQNILDETSEVSHQLDIRLVNDQNAVVSEAASLKPDLVILDVDFFIEPSAASVVHQLRQQDGLGETGILLTRSMMGDDAPKHGLGQDVEQCLANGASHFAGTINSTSFRSIVREYCR